MRIQASFDFLIFASNFPIPDEILILMQFESESFLGWTSNLCSSNAVLKNSLHLENLTLSWRLQPYLSGGFWWDLFVKILSTPPKTHNNPKIANLIRSEFLFNWSAPMNWKRCFRTFIIYQMILNWRSQNFL